MKLVLVVTVIFAATASLVSGTIITSRLLNNDKAMRYVKNTRFMDTHAAGLENWCPDLSEKLKKGFESLKTCDAAIPNSMTFCEAVQGHGLKCLRPIIKAFSECFPEKSKDLPELVAKSFISIVKYVCKQDGEHIVELSDTCAYEFPVFNQDPKVKECFDKLQKKIEQMQEIGEYPVKSEVCSFGNDVKYCFEIHINDACKNDKARSIHLGVMEASLKACNEA